MSRMPFVGWRIAMMDSTYLTTTVVVSVLVGTPDQNSLQERFLSSRIRANTALSERIRTRIVQGAGRCTRGPDDWAVVVVSGPDLTNYLMKPDTLDALEPELQAEIRFGIKNSRDIRHDEILENVEIFLHQAQAWRTDAEPQLQHMRNLAERVPPAGTELLAATADNEVEACSLAADGQWLEASKVAQAVAQHLGSGGDNTRGYRAFWLYLSGLWLDQHGEEAGSTTERHAARSLLEQAGKGSQTSHLGPRPSAAAGVPSRRVEPCRRSSSKESRFHHPQGCEEEQASIRK